MKKLSVIIPLHNEERRLANCLERLIPYLCEHYQRAHEIILVDNASTDDTMQIARAYANTYNQVYPLSIPIRGKGIAVKKGMEFACGRYRLMCDVDLSTPIEELPKLMDLTRFFDVVIGSRELKPAEVKTTLQRRVMGRIFHLLVSDLVPGVLDTQCGFKLFSDAAARAIFGRLKLPSMAFDVEALYLARLLGYTVGEVPVCWVHDADSRVRVVWDSLDMARDVLSIPWMHAQEKIPA